MCRRIRAKGVQTPILNAHCQSEEADRVTGLDVGADVRRKPFSVRELMAESVHCAADTTRLTFQMVFGDVEVDFRRYEARRNGKAVEMTRRTF